MYICICTHVHINNSLKEITILKKIISLKKGMKLADIKPTTSTQLKFLNGNINLSEIVWFLPLTKFNATKKKDFPLLEKSNILTLVYAELSRGSFKIEKRFKNAITVNICDSDKILNVKIYSKSIHIAGAKTEEHGENGAQMVIDHIKEIKKKLCPELATTNKKSLEKLSYVLKSCLQRYNERNSTEDRHLTEDQINKVYSECENIVPCLNYIIKNWLSVESIETIDIFATTISMINPSEITICDDNLAIRDSYIAMCNYNFDMGFKINLRKLKSFLNNYPDIIVIYERMEHHNLKINIPYKRTNTNVKDKKSIFHSFTVQCSGKISQSGPGREMMEPVFERIYNLLKNNRNEIEQS